MINHRCARTYQGRGAMNDPTMPMTVKQVGAMEVVTLAAGG